MRTFLMSTNAFFWRSFGSWFWLYEQGRCQNKLGYTVSSAPSQYYSSRTVSLAHSQFYISRTVLVGPFPVLHQSHCLIGPFPDLHQSHCGPFPVLHQSHCLVGPFPVLLHSHFPNNFLLITKWKLCIVQRREGTTTSTVDLEIFAVNFFFRQLLRWRKLNVRK